MFRFRLGERVIHNELIGEDSQPLQGKIVDRFNSCGIENWYTVKWNGGDRECLLEEELKQGTK